MKKNIRLNIIPIESSLKDVMNVLNKGVFGIVFVADKTDRIVGIFTDGDVRRSLLKGADLASSVQEHMNRDFVFAREGKSKEDYIKMLSERIRHLPVLDRKGRLIDFLSWAEMWRLPVMEPSLGGNELKYVSDCITSNWISSQGSYVRSFEKEFADYHGVDFALTTSSGTAALHLALLALGVGPGDEVIVPDLTFAATANTVVHAGAKPVFVDISEDYWNIDPDRIEAAITRNTRTIMPVHLYGHPCDMDTIMDLASKYSLFVVEDCAQALGAKYEGRLVGTFGDVGCFSFFSNKVITTGEGGMVITNNRTLYDRMTILRDHGMSGSKRYWHEVPGFNYRMTNLQAAVGLAQLENVNLFLKQRRFVAGVYEAHLKHVPGITLPPEMDWAENIYWLYSVLIEKEVLGISRDDLIIGLEREGVETRPFFYPLHAQPPYSDAKVDFPTSNRISRRGLSLPSSNGLQVEQIEQVCEMLRKVISHYKIVGDLRQRA